MTAAPWQNRIVGHAEVAPAQLTPNSRNWRGHPAAQQRALSGALSEVGWVAEILVNKTTGNLVDGHLRVELALARGEATVPVTFVELTETEERLVLATFDPLSAMAEAEKDQLAALLASLDPGEAALRELIDRLGRDTGIDLTRAGLVDPDDVPDVPAETDVQPGDLYRLGEHLLLCGDATLAASYDRLLGDETADVAFTDPPWNVAIGLDSNPRHRQRSGLLNDAMPSADFAAFLDSFASELLRRVSGDLYVVLGASEWPTLDRVLRDAGFHWSATIIWAKDAFVLGRSNYHRRYEPLWYGWRDGTSSSYVGGRAQDDVWEFARPRRSEAHPTMKPVELVARAITNSSASGGLVLDPFVGSGTTIIAAEQTGRCAAIELDPRYVAVAIDRWQTFTGKRAARADD